MDTLVASVNAAQSSSQQVDTNSDANAKATANHATAQGTQLSTNLYGINTGSFGGFLEALFSSFPNPPPSQSNLKPSVNGENLCVTTRDGYKIEFSNNNHEWWITSPDGDKTRIWGDPHVVESDGDKWDFHNKSSFLFGKNKITIETKDLGNGKAISKTVTVYSSEDRFTVTDIDKNEPKITGWSLDGSSHDKNLLDGQKYQLTIESDGTEEWVKAGKEKKE